MFAFPFSFLAKNVELLPVVQPFEKIRFTVLRWGLALSALSRPFSFWLLLRHVSRLRLAGRSRVHFSEQPGRREGVFSVIGALRGLCGAFRISNGMQKLDCIACSTVQTSWTATAHNYYLLPSQGTVKQDNQYMCSQPICI